MIKKTWIPVEEEEIIKVRNRIEELKKQFEGHYQASLKEKEDKKLAKEMERVVKKAIKDKEKLKIKEAEDIIKAEEKRILDRVKEKVRKRKKIKKERGKSDKTDN